MRCWAQDRNACLSCTRRAGRSVSDSSSKRRPHIRSSKPAGRGSPTLGWFDSIAAPWGETPAQRPVSSRGTRSSRSTGPSGESSKSPCAATPDDRKMIARVGERTVVTVLSRRARASASPTSIAKAAPDSPSARSAKSPSRFSGAQSPPVGGRRSSTTTSGIRRLVARRVEQHHRPVRGDLEAEGGGGPDGRDRRSRARRVPDLAEQPDQGPGSRRPA